MFCYIKNKNAKISSIEIYVEQPCEDIKIILNSVEVYQCFSGAYINNVYKWQIVPLADFNVHDM